MTIRFVDRHNDGTISDTAFDEILLNQKRTLNFKELKYDVYLAAGWFSPNKLKAHDMLQHLLEDELGLTVFVPKRDAPQIPVNPTQAQMDANFNEDVKAIEQSLFMVASTEGLDSGTIWEAGYAYKAGVKTFGYAPLLPEGVKFNLMLANSMQDVFLNDEDFLNYFKNGKLPAKVQAF